MHNCLWLLIHRYPKICRSMMHNGVLFCHLRHWMWSSSGLWNICWWICTYLFGVLGSALSEEPLLLILSNYVSSLLEFILLHTIHIETIFRHPNSLNSNYKIFVSPFVPDFSKMVMKPLQFFCLKWWKKLIFWFVTGR